MLLSQRVLNGLFRVLDLAEDVRASLRRLRGQPTPPPPWASWSGQAPAPTPPLQPDSPAPAVAPGTAGGFPALLTHVGREQGPRPPGDAVVAGKPLLGRVVWALALAEDRLGRGLSGAEVGALLKEAGHPSSPSSVLRAVRADAGTHVGRGARRGNAALLVLTDAGCAAAKALG